MAKRNRNKKTRPAAAHSRPAASAASTALMPEPLPLGGLVAAEYTSEPVPEAAAARPADVETSAGARPLLLTVAELCALLRVSRSTFYRHGLDGAIPGRVLIAGQVRYHRAEVERYLLELAKGGHHG